MPKKKRKSRKHVADVNQAAFASVQRVIALTEEGDTQRKRVPKRKKA